jgi:hypothetical protein
VEGLRKITIKLSKGRRFQVLIAVVMKISIFWDMVKVKGKVVPVRAVEALRVARDRGSHIFRSVHRRRQGCQPYAPAAFYPQEDF